jgi:hypothetical protein
MQFLGSVIKRALTLRRTLRRVRRTPSASQMQRKTLVKLLKKARHTAFGKHYEFDAILAANRPEKLFQKIVPIFDYESMHNQWWHQSLEGASDIAWPGKIKYFALSSGTSAAASKYIPVTNAMIRAMRKTSVRQILSLVHYDFPEELFAKGVLVLGGSSDLTKVGDYFQGDLSGINQANMPFYAAPFYKPGRQIAKHRDWNLKLDEIVRKAPEWDIAMLTGVPAWNQMVLERVIAHYKLNHIHEIWPNLSVFIYGGVALEPYKKGFDALLGKPIHYVETYLASEGFVAYQSRPGVKGMELVLNNGIFAEFVPFNETNFFPDGRLRPNAHALWIEEVEEGVEYAILLSTNAGAWRYLIGDTIRFTSLAHKEIIITGRTKHFLSLCGEHLSVDNMNRAVEGLAQKYNLSMPEFTVMGTQDGVEFGHFWYLGVDGPLPEVDFTEDLDHLLKVMNDDYALEREHALKHLRVRLVPVDWFYDWMDQQGKLGGQHKFPRVLDNDRMQDWLTFVEQKSLLA